MPWTLGRLAVPPFMAVLGWLLLFQPILRSMMTPRVLTWRSQTPPVSHFRSTQAPPPSSRLQLSPATASSSSPSSSPSGGAPPRIPQPGSRPPQRLPPGFNAAGGTELHSTALPATGAHSFSLWMGSSRPCMIRPSPTKKIPEGSWPDSLELKSGSAPKERPRPRSAPPGHVSGSRECAAGHRKLQPGAQGQFGSRRGPSLNRRLTRPR